MTASEILPGPALCEVNRQGLTPDETVIPTIEDGLAGRDPQLERAIRFLSGPATAYAT